MTKAEFTAESKRLAEAFPNQFPKARLDVLAKHVEGLDAKWFAKIVDRVILAHDTKFDFETIARSERLARKSYEQKTNETGSWSKLSRDFSNHGLKDQLEKLGVKSLAEILQKRKSS